MLTAIHAGKLFDGLDDQPLSARTVVIEGTRIAGVTAGDPALPDGCEVIETPILAPGFIDLQINGAGDVLFNDSPTVDTITAIASGARTGGAAYILPTFITAEGQAYRTALATVAEAIERRVPGVLGVHLEGPFLSPKRPGIHDGSAIRPIAAEDIERLTSWDAGVRLITLAPEEQPAGTVARLTEAGWTVFAGHSEASHRAMMQAADEGLRGVTHLFNAMRQMAPREPGVVGSALDDRRLFAGIIADGHHVHPAHLRLAAACLGAERLCLVTDAMPTLGGAATSFMLSGKVIRLDGGRLTDAEGTLAGAHLSMIEAVRTMRKLAEVGMADALRMASAAPATAIGLDHEFGRIAPGFRAGFTLLDDALSVRGVIVDGRLVE